MFVIGTAGHVDHGKSTLIKSLTGIDPDRLSEEKDRQMTIDLGFAWLKLTSGEEVGIVDVPGHSDFIENMVAGVGGIDIVLFVIAADEGTMPQTREHLAILDLLKINKGIIVLTKVDKVEENGWIDLVKTEIQSFVSNTFLRESPIVQVSSLTGLGMDNLVKEIEKIVSECNPRLDYGRPRLPIDRVFSLKGFGTIVTGTLQDGIFSSGQQVAILPEKINARIRGIQTHRQKIENAKPGSRVAINLTGINADEISRGDVVCLPDAYYPTNLINAEIDLINKIKKPLEHNEIVKLFSGTSSCMARVRVINDEKILEGNSGWLQIELTRELVMVKGDRFILRRPSPSETIGGGMVLEHNPDRLVKRFSQDSINRFMLKQTGSLQDNILAFLYRDYPSDGISIGKALSISQPDLKKILHEMVGKTLIVMEDPSATGVDLNYFIPTRIFRKIESDIISYLAQYHLEFPLRAGAPREQIRNMVNIDNRSFKIILNQLKVDNSIKETDGKFSLPQFTPELDSADNDLIKKIKIEFESKGVLPPSLEELRKLYDNEIVSHLIFTGDIVEISEDIVFLKEQLNKLKIDLINYLEKNSAIEIGQYRDIYKTSRKFALAILEYFDNQGITIRQGDKRFLKTLTMRE